MTEGARVSRALCRLAVELSTRGEYAARPPDTGCRKNVEQLFPAHLKGVPHLSAARELEHGVPSSLRGAWEVWYELPISRTT